MRLERAQMLEVEGGTPDWCMKILRHEAGHAFDNAYALRRRRRRVRLFGSPGMEYPDFYLPRPYSKSFVLHLDSWYAQSHPDEDFAETFAVWLTSPSVWRKRYQGWPALKKLLYVDEVMTEICQQVAAVRTRTRLDPVSGLRKTLGQHYEERRIRYGIDDPDQYDRDLQQLFSAEKRHLQRESTAAFIRSIRPDLLEAVCRWTGQSPYTVGQIVREMINRCRTLRLRLRHPVRRSKQDLVVLLTVHTMNDLQRGRLRLAL
jgi:hypothetical protein